MIELRRVVSAADAEVFLGVRNRIEPEYPFGRAAFESVRHYPERLDLVAYWNGVPIGVGSAGRHFDNPDGPWSFSNVRVARDHRRRGIGTAIFAAVAEHVAAQGKTGLYTVLREDDADSRGFLARRGWEEVLRTQHVRFELTRRSGEPVLPEGVELVTMAEALDALVYDAAVEIEQDLPAADDVVTGTLEEWRERAVGPLGVRACSFAALSGGQVVGYAILEDGEDGIAYHAMTGVRRGWRGRGLARALKERQLAAARAAGYREVRAANEVGNAPMRALNEKLGYTPLHAWLHVRGPLLR